MIQDATGKFSSRSPLPDRNSLAEVIEGWSTIVWTGRAFSLAPARAGDAAAAPIWGTTAAKRILSLDVCPVRIRSEKAAPGPPFVGHWPSLLVVVLQDLV